MAYFDNPERAAKWERELAELRAEKERRAALPPAYRRNTAMSLVPAHLKSRAAFCMARPAEAKVWRPPVRLQPPPAFRADSKAFAITPPHANFEPLFMPEPISFEALVAEAELRAQAAQTAEPVAASPEPQQKQGPAPEPITFSQLIDEAGQKQAV